MKLKLLIFLFSFTFCVVCTSCTKDTYSTVDCSETKTTANVAETDSIQRYLDNRNANGEDIEAIRHPRGFYYVIKNKGSEKDIDIPEPCSTIVVDYQGRRFDGTVIDEGERSTFNLYQNIDGWKLALPLIGVGGEIDFYLPPSLAYGKLGSGLIKPDTYLFFTVKLYSVTPIIYAY
ncbi:MAG: FKBP-type peptidyl-prolyl cis-trans isomerase [Chitinophagales bacterium]|nr:FKBP-type peptidyl-prolyl cis-trans isomerase [Chitinophagales bacterium]